MFYFIIFLSAIIIYPTMVLLEHLHNKLSREELSRYMLLSVLPIINIISFLILYKEYLRFKKF
jgi:hypothetical protein